MLPAAEYGESTDEVNAKLNFTGKILLGRKFGLPNLLVAIPGATCQMVSEEKRPKRKEVEEVLKKNKDVKEALKKKKDAEEALKKDVEEALKK